MASRKTAGSPRRRRSSGLASGGLIGAALIVAAVIFSNSLGGAREKQVQIAPVVGEFDTVRLPVPVEFVPAGTKVRDIRTAEISFPKHQVPPGALSSLEGYGDSLTVAPLPARLPLFAQNFSRSAAATNPVMDRIPPGMRAMSVHVDETSAVEGWAGSGSVVDVLLVRNEKTTVVAERVKVLSAERSVSPVEGDSTPRIPSTVTLLVTQEQCLAINTAIPLGRIAFALRSARDEQAWSDPTFTADQLRGQPATAAQKGPSVNGFVSIKGEKARNFALSNGKWIRSEGVPEGFLVNQEE